MTTYPLVDLLLGKAESSPYALLVDGQPVELFVDQACTTPLDPDSTMVVDGQITPFTVTGDELVPVYGRVGATVFPLFPRELPDVAPVGLSGSYDDLTDKPTIPTTPGEVGAEAAGAAAAAITAHVAATDPHGDRAYTDEEVGGALLEAKAYADDAAGDVAAQVVTEATARAAADAATLVQAKAYADALGVDLTALANAAEESDDIEALTQAVADLAAAPPEVTQDELDAEAGARATGDANTLASAATDATTKANNAQAAAASDATTKANAAQAAAATDATSKVATETTNRTTADALKIDKDSTFGAVTKAQAILNGGGTLTVTGAYNVRWATRFLAIGSGRGAHFSTAGFFDILMPANGTVITGVGGASSSTVASGLIPMSSAYVSLYYIPPIGSTSTSQAANFRLVGFSSDFVVPDHWILIARRNDEAGLVHWGNGSRVPAGQTLDVSGKTPTYFEVSTMRGLPGCLFYMVESAGIVTGFNYYLPFATDEPVTVSEMRCEVTSASTAGGKASFALYTADKAGQPVALHADFGEVAIDSIGVRTAVLGTAVFLPPGRYVLLQRASANCNMRRLGYNSAKFQNVVNALGANPYRTNCFVATAYTAVAPTTPVPWVGANVAADGAWRTYCVLGYTVAA